MKEYYIQYESNNIYDEKVSEAVFDFRVLPCNDSTQVVADFKMKNSSGETPFNFKNLFGFEVHRIRTTKDFKAFNFTLNAVVQKNDPDNTPPQWFDKEAEMAILNSKSFYIDHHLFLQKTSYTNISSANQHYILKAGKYESLYDYLTSLNRYVHQLLSYKKETTDVKTTADQALAIKSGVCQDYTHIFIGMCRYNGIPARYVSGYLNQGKDFLGNTLMHAWVEAFFPGTGWMGFDPTNDRLIDENYIKVSHGTDYADCSPIKGVLKTKGKNHTTYSVKVTQGQQQQQQ